MAEKAGQDGKDVMTVVCHTCGVELPNKWAVARRETVDGEVRCYCHLHANEDFRSKTAPQAPDAKGDQMTNRSGRCPPPRNRKSWRTPPASA